MVCLLVKQLIQESELTLRRHFSQPGRDTEVQLGWHVFLMQKKTIAIQSFKTLVNHKLRSPQKPHPNVCHSLNQTRTEHPKSEPWGGYLKSASSNRLSCRTRGSFNQHRKRYILKAIKVEQVTSPGSAGYFLSTLGISMLERKPFELDNATEISSERIFGVDRTANFRWPERYVHVCHTKATWSGGGWYNTWQSSLVPAKI